VFLLLVQDGFDLYRIDHVQFRNASRLPN